MKGIYGSGGCRRSQQKTDFKHCTYHKQFIHWLTNRQLPISKCRVTSIAQYKHKTCKFVRCLFAITKETAVTLNLLLKPSAPCAWLKGFLLFARFNLWTANEFLLRLRASNMNAHCQGLVCICLFYLTKRIQMYEALCAIQFTDVDCVLPW